MNTKYLWIDKTGLGHPSLVVIDVTGKLHTYPVGKPVLQAIEGLPVLRTYRMASFSTVITKQGKIKASLLNKIPAGYEFCWSVRVMNSEIYAFIIGVKSTKAGSVKTAEEVITPVSQS